MMQRFDPRTLLRLGRRDPREARCELWWSGSGIRALFNGSRLELEAGFPGGEHAPWLVVEVDGAPVARFPLRRGTHRYDALGSMEAGVIHEVSILRDTQPTEADAGPVSLDALCADGTVAAARPGAKLVEFLGDSLTVGEGTVGPTGAMEWRMAWISNRFAYPALVADALGAEKRVIALGGWGAHVSYDGDTGHTIGRIYDRLCAVVPGGDVAYDFEAQRPADAVVINLGTNDNAGLDRIGPRGAGERDFGESALRLLEQVRLRNPGAVILWAYGLCGNPLEQAVRGAVDRRQNDGDGNVFFLALDDCAGSLGSREHPSRAAHRRAAEQIARALEALI